MFTASTCWRLELLITVNLICLGIRGASVCHHIQGFCSLTVDVKRHKNSHNKDSERVGKKKKKGVGVVQLSLQHSLSVSFAILVHRWHQSHACVLALNSPHSKTPGTYFGASVSRSARPPPHSSLFLLLSLSSVSLPNLMLWLKLAPSGLVYKTPRVHCLHVSHIGFGVGFSSWPTTTPQTREMVSVAMFLEGAVSRDVL